MDLRGDAIERLNVESVGQPAQIFADHHFRNDRGGQLNEDLFPLLRVLLLVPLHLLTRSKDGSLNSCSCRRCRVTPVAWTTRRM